MNAALYIYSLIDWLTKSRLFFSPMFSRLVDWLIDWLNSELFFSSFFSGNMFTDQSAGEKKKTLWLDVLLQPVQGDSNLIRLNVLIALRLVQPFAIFLKLYDNSTLNQLMGSNYAALESPLEVRILNECLERLSPQACGARFPLTEEAEGKVLRTMMAALSLPGRFNVEAPAEVVLRQMFFMNPEHLGEDMYHQILQVSINGN